MQVLKLVELTGRTCKYKGDKPYGSRALLSLAECTVFSLYPSLIYCYISTNLLTFYSLQNGFGTFLNKLSMYFKQWYDR